MPSSRRARAERWVGRTLAGRYALGRVIGLGGHSAVFEATAVPDGARVAVKVLLLDEGTSPSVPERFLREAHTLGRVLHPNVVKVLDAGTDPLHGVAYIVQELLVGADLRTRLGSVGPLPPAAALAVVIPVARALEAAHAAGVVHRDLKPANVFLVRGADGAVLPKLIDFGIARRAEADEEPLTQDGALLGTPDYMSPEQARGRIDLDGRSDVWSLAVLLYETLAGRRPFTGPNYNAVILAIAHDDPPRLDALVEGLPPALVEAVHRALDKDPAKRTATMEAFRTALERVAATLGPSAPHGASEPTAEALLAGGPRHARPRTRRGRGGAFADARRRVAPRRPRHAPAAAGCGLRGRRAAPCAATDSVGHSRARGGFCGRRRRRRVVGPSGVSPRRRPRRRSWRVHRSTRRPSTQAPRGHGRRSPSRPICRNAPTSSARAPRDDCPSASP